jgi:hypothetical protein
MGCPPRAEIAENLKIEAPILSSTPKSSFEIDFDPNLRLSQIRNITVMT